MASDAATAKKVITPFNIVAGAIVVIGIVITILRFTKGLGAVTNLDDNNPWGIWIGFDLLCGVALAAGGYVTSAACYIFGLKRYHAAVRPAILTAFLGYALVVLPFIMMWDGHGGFLIRFFTLPVPHHFYMKWVYAYFFTFPSCLLNTARWRWSGWD